MRPVLTVEGRRVLFVHWPFAPGGLRPHVPDPLELDVRDGRAWVSALAHRVHGVRPRGLPAPPDPLDRSFPQLNVRTYVRHRGEPGVYFLDCETGDRIGAVTARRVWGLPFYRADMDMTARGGRVTFRSRRSGAEPVRFDARYRADGEPSPAEAGSLADFLIERSRWYVVDGGVRLGTIERDPWQVAPASASVDETLLGPLGLPDPAGEPRLHYSPGYEMDATPLRPAGARSRHGGS